MHVPLQLEGFHKAVDLAPGENKEIIVRLDRHAFKYRDVVIDSWMVKLGGYSC